MSWRMSTGRNALGAPRNVITSTGTIARIGPKNGFITKRPMNTARTPENATPNTASVMNVATPEMRRRMSEPRALRRERRQLIREARDRVRARCGEQEEDRGVDDEHCAEAVEARALIDPIDERRQHVGERPRRAEDDEHVGDPAERVPEDRE